MSTRCQFIIWEYNPDYDDYSRKLNFYHHHDGYPSYMEEDIKKVIDSVPDFKIETLKKICDTLQISPFVLIYPEKITNLRTLRRYYFSEKKTKYISKLNDEGAKKVIEYAKDLYDTGKYLI